ncbi:MAG: hypothetical protein ACXVAR_18140 [Vulcanimicrobiaceae bacterium]
MERHVITPVRVRLEEFGAAEDWAAPEFVFGEDADEPLRELTCNLPKIEHVSGAGGILDLKVVAVQCALCARA